MSKKKRTPFLDPIKPGRTQSPAELERRRRYDQVTRNRSFSELERRIAYQLLDTVHRPATSGLTAGIADREALEVEETVWLDTPGRWLKALREMTTGYDVDIPSLFKTFDGTRYDGMVIVGPLKFWSLCEHHLLPFHGNAWVGYLPDQKTKRIVGLSKVARLVDAHAKRLQVQERMTADIANDLRIHLSAAGVGVRIESTHTCMCARGVSKEGLMRTQSLTGLLRDSGTVREEFNQLVRSANNT